MYTRALIVLGLLASASACKSASAASPSSMEYAVYDFEDDSIDGEMMMEPASEDDGFRRDARRSRRADRVQTRGESFAEGPGAPPEMEPAPVAGGGGDAGAPEPAVATDDDVPDHGRHIIYTASMQVAVFNLQDAMARAETLPTKYGGYVQNMSSNVFVMRIPAEKLRTAMEDMAGLGTVQYRNLDAQDVSEEYLDIETRIAVLEATQKQMLELLTKARTVEEALKVRQALDQITMDLEVLKGRLRRLGSLVSFSTLTLNLVERGPHNATPSSNDPYPWVDRLGVEATEWK